jgi:hypothetical protein
MIFARSMTVAAALLVAGSFAATAQTSPQTPAQGERGTQMRAVAQACKPDIEKFCKDVQRGGGRIAQCLQANAADLSADCRKAMPQQPQTPAK